MPQTDEQPGLATPTNRRRSDRIDSAKSPQSAQHARSGSAEIGAQVSIGTRVAWLVGALVFLLVGCTLLVAGAASAKSFGVVLELIGGITMWYVLMSLALDWPVRTNRSDDVKKGP